VAGEPVFLCTQQELVGDADDDEALRQMEQLASILAKLGYHLASGTAPRFDELWAIPIAPSSEGGTLIKPSKLIQ
jgi:hypothetical protein